MTNEMLPAVQALEAKGLEISPRIKARADDIAILRGIITARPDWQQYREQLDRVVQALLEEDAEIQLDRHEKYEFVRDTLFNHIIELTSQGALRGARVADFCAPHHGEWPDYSAHVELKGATVMGYTPGVGHYDRQVYITEPYADIVRAETYGFFGATSVPSHLDFEYFWQPANGCYSRIVTPTQLPGLVVVESRGDVSANKNGRNDEWPLFLKLNLLPEGSPLATRLTKETVAAGKHHFDSF